MIKCIINDSTLNIESVIFSYSVSKKKGCRIKSIINHDERFDLKVFWKAGELPSTLRHRANHNKDMSRSTP